MRDYDLAIAAQEKLTRAFALIRKRGVVARQRYKCCGTCAGYAIGVEVAEKVTKDARVKDKFKGVVFYTKQGGFFDRGGVGSCYLKFGQVDTKEHGPVGLPTVEVGKIVCECLAEAGLAFEWDGTENKCVAVLFTPPPPPEPKTAFERVLQDATL